MSTINDLMIFFSSKLIQYDARCATKGDSNLYRLGHLMKAYHALAARLDDIRDMPIDHLAAVSFRVALSKEFIVETRGGTGKPSGIAPVSQVLCALEKAVITGKVPSICDPRSHART